MGNIRLFFSNILSAEMTDRLDKSQSHYLNKVMRLKENEVFSLFNDNGEWEAKVLGVSKGIVEFKIIKQLRKKENSKELWLAFSPIKSNYQNFMIQKATELGVTKFLPIIFDRTVVRKINNERIEKIVVEASEQSNRLNVPEIKKAQNLKNFLNSNSMDLIFQRVKERRFSLLKVFSLLKLMRIF
jgi:16S rRNA (uracil1498-N3)-methyltransferase